jgi:hypothetical protein
VTPAPRRAAKSRRAAASAAEPVVFRGPPDRLASLLPVAAEAGTEPSASVEGTEVRALRVRRLARDGPARATLRLSASTPPGSYTGTAELEGETVPIVAEVEPRPSLRSAPRRLVVEAEPGTTVTVDVALVNTGNVPCDVSGTTSFCLFDGGGVEHAVWAALASDPPEGKQRIDVLLDDLAESHGGLVTTKVERGATIPAGETRTVQLTLRFSDRLRPGKRYAGAWRVEGLRVPIRITTPETTPKRKGKEAR